MGLADLFIRKQVVSWLSIVLLLAGGYLAYSGLGRYEDPEFVIRVAVIVVPYPGASALEVADEVTDVIEEAVQQLQELDTVTSVSKPGYAEVHVEIDRAFSPDKATLAQVWTKLRNKLKDAERGLPPGAGPVIVNDDFGDVFSLFYAVTGDGYSFKELNDYVDRLRKDLLIVPGVARVALLGEQQEQISVEIDRVRLAQLGIPLQAIFSTLGSQNVLANSGDVRVGPEFIRIAPVGNVDSVEAIGALIITGSDPSRQLRLRDVATIRREYQEPPSCLVRVQGKPGIGIGVSNVSGGNVVTMGDAVKERLKALEPLRPVGMELYPISIQSDTVRESIGSFLSNLVAAIVIVVITLLIFMGLRSGLIIGFVLLLIIAATLITMYIANIDMQRVSLGALIIALGMLVDNAIVVVEGVLVGTQRGDSAEESARRIVGSTIWPLLGGTIVGLLAFSPIGLSPDNTGEFAGSLFWVIAYSLLLSWLFAVTITPFLCTRFMRPGTAKQTADPYGNHFYRGYARTLTLLLRFRLATVAAMLLLLGVAIYAFTYVPAGFFPDSSRAQFVVDYWRPQGTDIRSVDEDLRQIETYVRDLPGVTGVTTVVGQGALRFMLTYSPEQPARNYGTLLIDVSSPDQIPDLLRKVSDKIAADFPDADAKAWKFVLGPGGGAKIEAEFTGPDSAVLRDLSEQAKTIMFEDGEAIGIKDDWRERVKVIRPEFSEVQARRAGVTMESLRQALAYAFGGVNAGLYREGDNLIPIVAQAPAEERMSVDMLQGVQVPSSTGRSVPIGQVISGVSTGFEDALYRREDRFPTIKAQCDPDPGVLTSVLFERIRPKIEAIALPPGYALNWGGEYGDSTEAQAGLNSTIPYGLAAMVIVVILLFNALRQPIVIWSVVPLSIIGVAFGLLVFQAPFEFMAMLGFLSLVGMLIKNAIVLVDQIDVEIREGKPRHFAVIDSAMSRVRPVSMGALTTVLGVAPLILDPFFRSMAVVIMFGLTFATILTLLVVPVVYALIFRIHPDPKPLPATK
jgi:multidrug efflux pump subunit AcrB